MIQDRFWRNLSIRIFSFFRFSPALFQYWFICLELDLKYVEWCPWTTMALPKLFGLNCCSYIPCLQSGVLFQDFCLAKFSNSLFLFLNSDLQAPSSLFNLLWECWKLPIKFFIGHVLLWTSCTILSIPVLYPLRSFPLYQKLFKFYSHTGEQIQIWLQIWDVLDALVSWV